MSREVSLEELRARNALYRSAWPVRCKTGLATSRAGNRKVVHHVRSMKAACTEGRIQFFAGWVCGDGSDDVAIVADPEPFGGICKRCASIKQGPFVYRCFRADRQVIYIGSAKCRLTRMQSHRTSPWWGEVAYVEFEDQPDIETARRAEVAAIETECPLINKKHNTRRFRRVGPAYVPVAEAA